MAITASREITPGKVIPPWQGFQTGIWQKEINVRDFIQKNHPEGAIARRRITAKGR